MAVWQSLTVPEFRVQYKSTRLPKFYSGTLHGTWIILCCVLGIGFCLWQARHLSFYEALSIPAFLLIASNAEYFFHRYVLHRRVAPISFVYRLHTLEHHHYFTNDHMAYESTRDFNMVFFPHFAPVGLFAGLSLIAYFIFRPLFSENVAYLFVACGMGHYFMYEIIHFCSHYRPESRLGRTQFVSFLRHHHALHHQLSEMSHKNFNITLPICDWLYRTWQ